MEIKKVLGWIGIVIFIIIVVASVCFAVYYFSHEKCDKNHYQMDFHPEMYGKVHRAAYWSNDSVCDEYVWVK